MPASTVPGRLPVLSARIRNRSALSRQLLLGPGPEDLVEAVGQVAGIQAQYANEPHIALAARMQHFQPSDLNGALDRRDVIRATLMRGTIHIMTRPQAAFALKSTADIHHRAWGRLVRSQRVPLDEMRAAVIRWCQDEPRTHQEISAWLLERFPGFPEPAHQIWRVVSATGDLVHASPSGHFNNFARPRYYAATAFLEPCADVEAADRRLLRAYLGAFGPATVRDAGKWSGLTLTRIRAAISSLDLAPPARDELGEELFWIGDLGVDGSEKPGVRLLPAWDNLLMGYANRSRFLDPRLAPEVVHRNGDISPIVLVDGRVAARWRVLRHARAWTFHLKPLVDMSRRSRRRVEDAVDRLAESLRVPNQTRWSPG